MDVLFQSDGNGIKVLLGKSEDPGIFTIASFSDFIMGPDEDSNC